MITCGGYGWVGGWLGFVGGAPCTTIVCGGGGCWPILTFLKMATKCEQTNLQQLL